jgi:hypothetical protein
VAAGNTRGQGFDWVSIRRRGVLGKIYDDREGLEMLLNGVSRNREIVTWWKYFI